MNLSPPPQADAFDLADARLLLGPSARFLARGMTCTVYTDRRRVARLALPAGESGEDGTRLFVQAAVQQALAQTPAAPHIAQVLEVGQLPNGRAYLIETLVRGDDESVSAAGWQQLGEVLRELHALPCQGFGLLAGDAHLVGVAQTPEEGILSRLEGVWPFDSVTNAAPLEQHTLLRHAPELAPLLRRLEPALRRAAQQPAVICHTDLHPEQLLWNRGRLAALLDFGDATIAPPAWDIASLAFFHGWEVAAQVARAAGLPCGPDAALFGLMLAFHRAERATQQGKPQRLAQAAAFARVCTERLA